MNNAIKIERNEIGVICVSLHPDFLSNVLAGALHPSEDTSLAVMKEISRLSQRQDQGFSRSNALTKELVGYLDSFVDKWEGKGFGSIAQGIETIVKRLLETGELEPRTPSKYLKQCITQADYLAASWGGKGHGGTLNLFGERYKISLFTYFLKISHVISITQNQSFRGPARSDICGEDIDIILCKNLLWDLEQRVKASFTIHETEAKKLCI